MKGTLTTITTPNNTHLRAAEVAQHSNISHMLAYTLIENSELPSVATILRANPHFDAQHTHIFSLETKNPTGRGLEWAEQDSDLRPLM
jgi:hypothetical protein